MLCIIIEIITNKQNQAYFLARTLLGKMGVDLHFLQEHLQGERLAFEDDDVNDDAALVDARLGEGKRLPKMLALFNALQIIKLSTKTIQM